MILSLIDQAHGAGARRRRICETLGLSVRTLERWRTQPDGGEDRRRGPKNPPPNSLSTEERAQVLTVATSTEFRDLSPKQIVPLLADRGLYLASESSFYRILRQAELLGHREPSRAPIERHRPTSHTAYGPGELWSWDITYLLSSVRGQFHYLYMLVDLYSRKVVGWAVHECESMDLAAALVAKSCAEEGIDPKGLVLHSDNGGPMKGSTMLAMLQRLGIVPSFSRPATSDDNPYSEALFRTLKYRPSYPHRPFRSIEHAQGWVSEFVRWYNDHHLHSALNFVTPSDRHAGLDALILDARHALYQKARNLRPERWSKQSRDWTTTGEVHLNPQPKPPEVVSLHLSPSAALAGLAEPTDRLVSSLNTLGQI